MHVVVRRANSHVEVCVTDNGKGIPEAFLGHVFDRFRQADASTTRHQGGLGLGLSIVKHLTELHGGTVRVASDGLNKGASFTISFPLRPVQHEAEEAQGEPSKALANQAAKPDLSGVRVLAIDDEDGFGRNYLPDPAASESRRLHGGFDETGIGTIRKLFAACRHHGYWHARPRWL